MTEIVQNTLKYSDMHIGMSRGFQYVVTEQGMDLFLKMTGDANLLHQDVDFAKEHGFHGKVAYGMLSCSLLSTLAGMCLPGKYCLLQQVSAKFLRPVYPGDTLYVSGTVAELHDSVEQAVLKVEIKNQDGEKTLKGKLSVGFLGR